MKPRIFVFSIGEATTDLCMWALERFGFEPVLYQDNTLLWEKLKRFYNEPGEMLYRCDADIIPNRDSIKITQLDYSETWWWHTKGWGWYRQNITSISIAGMTRQAADIAAKHIDEAKNASRPETAMSRLPEFFSPRRYNVADLVTGLHGYGQTTADIARVRAVKHERRQDELFDWGMFNSIRRLRTDL